MKTSILVKQIPCMSSYLFILCIHLEVKLKSKVYYQWLEWEGTIPNELIVTPSPILGAAEKDCLPGKSFGIKLFKKHQPDHKATAQVYNQSLCEGFYLVVFLVTFDFQALQNHTFKILFQAVTGNILMLKFQLRFLPSKKKMGAAALRKPKIAKGKQPKSDKAARVNSDDGVSQAELHASSLLYSYYGTLK